MSAIIYKCPNCGGSLVYDPESGMCVCEYCLSKFAQGDFTAASQAAENEPNVRMEEPEPKIEEEKEHGAVLYRCPSCGAEIITEETTAATFCFYCHNPVVLAGRLEGEYLPDGIITFEYTKEQAIEKFHEWIQDKKFIQKGFYSKHQIEKMTGVYFPYWLYHCEMDNHIVGNSKDIQISRVGNVEYTETKIYQISRSGKLTFRYIPKNALQKAQSDLLKGVFPYEFGALKKFHMDFLSGFQAEKRDVEKESIRENIRQNAMTHAKQRMRNTVSGHTSFSLEDQQCKIEEEKFQYVLLPVWILTYKAQRKEPYYFAMNGQTGEVVGKLPVSHFKINVLCMVIFWVVFVLTAIVLGGIV